MLVTAGPRRYVPAMPRYLIEVAHDPDTVACVHAIEVFLRTGSHYLTHADWGCKDDVHKAWMVLELDTREEALHIVPADFRGRATIVELSKFTPEKLDKLQKKHGLKPA